MLKTYIYYLMIESELNLLPESRFWIGFLFYYMCIDIRNVKNTKKTDLVEQYYFRQVI